MATDLYHLWNTFEIVPIDIPPSDNAFSCTCCHSMPMAPLGPSPHLSGRWGIPMPQASLHGRNPKSVSFSSSRPLPYDFDDLFDDLMIPAHGHRPPFWAADVLAYASPSPPSEQSERSLSKWLEEAEEPWLLIFPNSGEPSDIDLPYSNETEPIFEEDDPSQGWICSYCGRKPKLTELDLRCVQCSHDNCDDYRV